VLADAFLLDRLDHAPRGLLELVDVVGRAAEAHAERVLLPWPPRDAASRRDAVDAAHVLAQHLAQANAEDLAEHAHVVVGVARPRLVAVEGERDGALRLAALHDLLL